MKHIRLGRPQVFNVQTGDERCYFCDKPPTGACRSCGAHVCDDHDEHQGQDGKPCPTGSVHGAPKEDADG